VDSKMFLGVMTGQLTHTALAPSAAAVAACHQCCSCGGMGNGHSSLLLLVSAAGTREPQVPIWLPTGRHRKKSTGEVERQGELLLCCRPRRRIAQLCNAPQHRAGRAVSRVLRTGPVSKIIQSPPRSAWFVRGMHDRASQTPTKPCK